MRSDRGSGTLLMLLVMGMVLCAAVVLLAVGAEGIARRHAQLTADAAARAAASAAVGIDCARAGSVAAASGGRVVSCTVAGADVDVVIEVLSPPIVVRLGGLAGRSLHTVTAAARAGPA